MSNRLQEIKNEVAKEIGYNSSNEYLSELKSYAGVYFIERLNTFQDEATQRYAKEVAQASLEKAYNNAKYEMIKYTDDYEVTKESITNSENIILL